MGILEWKNGRSMTCEEFEAAWQELDDFAHLPPSLQEHRCVCPACGELVEDLHQIQQQARQMLPVEQPSERVWQEIHRQLQLGGLIQDPARRPGFFRHIPVFAGFPRLPMGLAYAAVFLLALGVVYLHRVLTEVPAPLPVASAPAITSAAPAAEARASVTDQSLRQMFEKIPAEKRATYEANLQRVNSSIQQLSAFLEEHPEDLFARELRREAYEQKNHLSESLVRWEEF